MGTTPSFLSVTNGHISDRSGRSLYALTKIPKGSVNPYQFGNLWIPLISSNMPYASNGVNENLISGIPVSGGFQVTYNKYPLYLYRGDSGTSTLGQGLEGIFWLIDPSGTPVNLQNQLLSYTGEISSIGNTISGGVNYITGTYNGNVNTLYTGVTNTQDNWEEIAGDPSKIQVLPPSNPNLLTSVDGELAYNGHPLYIYLPDRGSTTLGWGVDSAKLISPEGVAIPKVQNQLAVTELNIAGLVFPHNAYNVVGHDNSYVVYAFSGAPGSQFTPITAPVTINGLNTNMVSIKNGLVYYGNYELYEYNQQTPHSTNGLGIEGAQLVLVNGTLLPKVQNQLQAASNNITGFTVRTNSSGQQYLADQNGMTLYWVPDYNKGNYLFYFAVNYLCNLTTPPQVSFTLLKNILPTGGGCVYGYVNGGTVVCGFYSLQDNNPGDINGLSQGGYLISPSGMPISNNTLIKGVSPAKLKQMVSQI